MTDHINPDKGGSDMTNRPEMNYETATAIGSDAANRQMRSDGRTCWNDKDFTLASAEFNRVFPQPEKENRIMKRSTLELYKDALVSEDAWMDELKLQFGAEAGTARYEPRGTGTALLKELYEAWAEDTEEWRTAYREDMRATARADEEERAAARAQRDAKSEFLYSKVLKSHGRLIDAVDQVLHRLELESKERAQAGLNDVFPCSAMRTDLRSALDQATNLLHEI